MTEKNPETTIYILTDVPRDAKDICDANNLSWNHGKPIDPEGRKVLWIDGHLTWHKLIGRKIYPDDLILWGHFNNISSSYHITKEIEMRQSHEG